MVREKDNGVPLPDRQGRPVSHSRMDSDFMARRTEMYQNLRIAGYDRIGTGDPKNVPKRKPKRAVKQRKGAKR